MTSALSTCRLCRKNTELRASHIFPDFFGRGGEEFYPTGRSGNLLPFTQPVHTGPGRRFQRMQRGYWERRIGQIEKLLCHDCEQLFSGFEHYVKSYFYGRSHPIRFRKELESGKTLAADYPKMKLFQLSLLWRVSVASGSAFSKVALADRHNNRIAEMLLNRDPGSVDRYPCTIWRMVVSEPVMELVRKSESALETMSFEPASGKYERGKSAVLFLGGLVWVFWVGDASPPTSMGRNYIVEDGNFYFDDYNVDNFFREFAAKVVAAGNITLADVEANRAAKRRN